MPDHLDTNLPKGRFGGLTIFALVLTLLASLVLVSSREAQSVEPVWSQVQLAGGSGADSAFAAAYSSVDDSMFVGGAFAGTASFGSSTLVASGDSFDGFVSRLDATGSWVWTVPLTGAGNAGVVALASAPDGGVVVLGSFDGFLQTGSTTLQATAFTRDIFVGKLTADGSWAWSHRLGGAYHDAGTSLAATDDGGAVVVGNFSGSFAAGDHLLAATGLLYDGFVLKLSLDGSIPWASTIRGSLASTIADVAVSSKGEIAVAGSASPGSSFGSLVLKTAPRSSTMTAFFATLTPTGSWSSLLSFPSRGNSAATALTPSRDGFKVVGTFTGSLEVPINNATSGSTPGSTPSPQLNATLESRDLFLASVSGDSKIVWIKPLGGLGEETPTDLYVSKDDFTLVSATFTRPLFVASTALRPTGGADAMLVRADPAGTWVWGTSLGGPGADSINALVSTGSSLHLVGSLDDVASPEAKGGLDVYIASLEAGFASP